MEMIVAAAVMSETGLITTLPQPARHHTIINMIFEMGLPKTLFRYQGFITSTGRFLHRKEAAELAFSNGQITAITLPDCLLSEDLW